MRKKTTTKGIIAEKEREYKTQRNPATARTGTPISVRYWMRDAIPCACQPAGTPSRLFMKLFRRSPTSHATPKHPAIGQKKKNPSNPVKTGKRRNSRHVRFSQNAPRAIGFTPNDGKSPEEKNMSARATTRIRTRRKKSGRLMGGNYAQIIHIFP